MSERRRKTVLIHVGFSAAHAEAWTRPHPGIWWATDEVVAAVLEPPARAERCGGLLDSSLAHAQEWPAVAIQFKRSPNDNYFVVPRGRVLLQRKTGYGLIYHGNETKAATLRQIARAFNLTEWQAKMDEHYLMGAEADRLFDEDFLMGDG